MTVRKYKIGTIVVGKSKRLVGKFGVISDIFIHGGAKKFKVTWSTGEIQDCSTSAVVAQTDPVALVPVINLNEQNDLADDSAFDCADTFSNSSSEIDEDNNILNEIFEDDTDDQETST